MIMADKIIELRKKNGWSQEDLAYKLNVSRQSVSKWESMQSIPELDKILQMAELFGVTTDYLIKDDIEGPQPNNEGSIPANNATKVSLKEANDYMKIKEETAGKFALGVSLCILSPITLMMLCGFEGKLSEQIIGIVGLGVLFVFVALAVVIFIYNYSKISKYEFLEKKVIETEYGVTSIVKEKKENFKDKYTKGIMFGVALYIIGAMSVCVCGIFENQLLVCGAISFLLCIASIGTFVIVKNGNIMNSYTKLLQEGDYSVERKTSKVNKIAPIYWPAITAVYLAISFITNLWNWTWIIWPVAGTLYAAIVGIVDYASGDKK